MNQQQRKYAKDRLDKIRTLKLSKVDEEYTKKAVQLSPKERLKAFRQGKYKIKKTISRDGIYGGTSVSSLVDFDGESDHVVDEAKIAIYRDRINKEHQKIMDELMLGDNKKALELIKNFESKVF